MSLISTLNNNSIKKTEISQKKIRLQEKPTSENHRYQDDERIKKRGPIIKDRISILKKVELQKKLKASDVEASYVSS